jgi:hypothetical protein
VIRRHDQERWRFLMMLVGFNCQHCRQSDRRRSIVPFRLEDDFRRNINLPKLLGDEKPVRFVADNQTILGHCLDSIQTVYRLLQHGLFANQRN